MKYNSFYLNDHAHLKLHNFLRHALILWHHFTATINVCNLMHYQIIYDGVEIAVPDGHKAHVCIFPAVSGLSWKIIKKSWSIFHQNVRE